MDRPVNQKKIVILPLAQQNELECTTWKVPCAPTVNKPCALPGNAQLLCTQLSKDLKCPSGAQPCTQKYIQARSHDLPSGQVININK